MLRSRLLAALTATAALTVLAIAEVAPTAASSGLAAAAPNGQSDRPSCGGERPFRPGGGRYSCTFEDDFDGTVLDTSKWVVQDTSLSGVSAGDRGCYVNDPDNIGLGGGLLRLTSRKEAEPFVCKNPYYGDYTTDRTAATIGSWNRFNQTYGRFEFRARMPATTEQGVQSALWLYPQKHLYGAWPNSGEIDVAEWFSGYPSHVFPSVHYAGEDWRQSTGFNCPVAGSGTQFHRYAVEWTETQMRFLYDGQLCFTHAWTPDAPLVAPQPFDKPFYVVLTQVFGGDWNVYTESTPTEASMYVDWVRVWR